jgi:hypothetical protein
MIDTSAPTLGREITSPASKAISIPHAVMIAAALGFQALGLYAAWATFGAWITLGLYAVGGLAVLLQHVVARWRAASW